MWTGAPIFEEIKLRFALSLPGGDHGHRRGAWCWRSRSGSSPRSSRTPGWTTRCASSPPPDWPRRHSGCGILFILDAPDRLQVAAADGVHAVLVEPLAEHGPAHLAGARRRLPVLGGGHAHDPLGDARGAARGLHPDRAGRRGCGGSSSSSATRSRTRMLCRVLTVMAPGVRLPPRRPGGDRAGLQPQRAPVSSSCEAVAAPRLHAGAGARDARGRRLHHRELPGGHGLRRGSTRASGSGSAMALNVPAVGDVAEPLASERGWLGRGRASFCRRRPWARWAPRSVLLMLVAARSSPRSSRPTTRWPPTSAPCSARRRKAHLAGHGRLRPRRALAAHLRLAHRAHRSGFARGVRGRHRRAPSSAWAAPISAGGSISTIQRLMDVFLSFPLIILALAIVAMLGNTMPERDRGHHASP